MKPSRTIEILTKMRDIHKNNPRLAMTDITNAEIIDALGIGAEAVKFLVEIAEEALGEGGEKW